MELKMSLKGELAEYQKQLAELSDKLKVLKKKYLGKSESRRSAEVKRMRREAERVGSDLRFVQSLLEGLEDLDTSLASKLLKRVIPSKAPPPVQDISAEFKQSLLAFSARFFQDRLHSIESSVRPPNKDDTELDSTQSSSPFSEGSRPEFSQVNSELGRLPYRAGACFYHCTEPSEKSVQTDYCDFVPKLCFSNSSEKFVQTDDPTRSTIIGEILEALKKISEDYVPSDRSAFHESDFSNDGFSVLSAKDSEWGDGPPHAEFEMNRRDRDRKKDKNEAFQMKIRAVDIGDEAKCAVPPEGGLANKSSTCDRNSEKTNSRKVHIFEFHETGLGRMSMPDEKEQRFTNAYIANPFSGVDKKDTMKSNAGVTKAKSYEVELWPTREKEFQAVKKTKSRENKSEKTRTKSIKAEQHSSSKKMRNSKSYESDFRSDSGQNLNDPQPYDSKPCNDPHSTSADKRTKKSYTKLLKKSESHKFKHRHSEETIRKANRKARRCNSSESSYHKSHKPGDAAQNVPAITMPYYRSSRSLVTSRPKSRRKEFKSVSSQEKELETRAHDKQKYDRSSSSRPKSSNKERRKVSKEKDLQDREFQNKSSGRDKWEYLTVKSSISSNPASTKSENIESSGSGNKVQEKKISKDSLKKKWSSDEGMKENMNFFCPCTMPNNKEIVKETVKVEPKEESFHHDAIDVVDRLDGHASELAMESNSSEKGRSKESFNVGEEEVMEGCGELDKSSRLSSSKKGQEEESEERGEEGPELEAGSRRVEVVGASQRLLRVCLQGPTWPEVFHRRETEGRVTRDGGVTVRLAKHLDTLLISHSHQPGTIILADFGGSPTQAEILGRIVGYLVGVPPPTDKT